MARKPVKRKKAVKKRAVVKSMESSTFHALLSSIIHWAEMVRDNSFYGNIGTGNCALCQRFHDNEPLSLNHGTDAGCRGCPVAEDTGHPGCGGTPYDFFQNELRTDGGAAGAGLKELKYLVSLLPTKNPYV